jgi:hypothetical protein
VIFHVSAEEEQRALKRSAARAGCRVSAVASRDVGGARRAVGQVECADGWAAARLLLALAEEDARTPGARALALELRRQAPSDEEFAAAVHAFVKERVRFVREPGEVFQGGGFTLSSGGGDCDDHARLVYAIARAGGLPAVLAFLHRGGQPTHVVAKLCPRGACQWAETTVDAELGEEPTSAAARLGLTRARDDIAQGVRIMSDKDLPPVPAGYRTANPAAKVERDAHALERLGFLCSSEGIGDAADPAFRRAVAEFQRSRGGRLKVDGQIGPKTRAEIARALVPDEFGIGYLGELTASAPRLTKHLSSKFFRDVVAMAERFREKGADIKPENLLSVWLVESGLKPWVQNGSGAPYYGLNQIGTRELAAVGFVGTPADYLSLSADAQLPYVERYYARNVAAFAGGDWSKLNGAGALYLMNFLPAFISHADEPEFVLARKSDDPHGWYRYNAILDVDDDDTTRAVGRAQVHAGDYWLEVRRRLYAEGGAPEESGSSGTAIVGVALLVATGALAAWQIIKG